MNKNKRMKTVIVLLFELYLKFTDLHICFLGISYDILIGTAVNTPPKLFKTYSVAHVIASVVTTSTIRTVLSIAPVIAPAVMYST